MDVPSEIHESKESTSVGPISAPISKFQNAVVNCKNGKKKHFLLLRVFYILQPSRQKQEIISHGPNSAVNYTRTVGVKPFILDKCTDEDTILPAVTKKPFIVNASFDQVREHTQAVNLSVC